MRKWIGQLVVAAVMLVCPLAAGGAAAWTLTTADFEKQRVQLLELRDQTLVVAPLGSQETKEVPFADFLELELLNDRTRGGEGLTLHLVDGGRLVGMPARMEGDSIIWETGSIGEVPASLRRAVGITRAGQALPRAAGATTQDRVQLLNGDVLEGVLADASGESLIMQVVGGDPVPVPLDSVSMVTFAAGVRDEAARRPGFQIRLTDGSRVRAGDVALQEGKLKFEVAGVAREVALEAVQSIEQVNGPVTWLSDIPPTANEQRPFMGEAVPARFNETLDGRPITIEGQRVGKGIAVHSYSKLSYDVSEGFERFRARYAIDGDGRRADVTVRVLVDGKVVHEQANVHGGAVSSVVTADLKGAKELVLEVDYGELYDVQDRLIWVEPALLR